MGVETVPKVSTPGLGSTALLLRQGPALQAAPLSVLLGKGVRGRDPPDAPVGVSGPWARVDHCDPKEGGSRDKTLTGSTQGPPLGVGPLYGQLLYVESHPR